MKDMKESRWSLMLMIGLIFLGLMLPVAVAKYKSYDRYVSVKGLCEREVNADKVIWPLVYKSVGNDLNLVYNNIESNNSVIIKFLTDGGIPASDITVSVPVVSDKFTQEYGSNDRAFRFVAKNVITVCTRDVDKVLALMEKQANIIKSGIALEEDWESRTEFSFNALNDIKPEMVEEATKNARQTAEKFAKDSDSRLGKIREASQGTFTITDRDSNTPYIKTVRVVTSVTYYLKN